jgi:meiosis-specific protein HOP1
MLGIFINPDDPNNLVESYTFNIERSTEGDEAISLRLSSSLSPDTLRFTRAEILNQMQTVLRKLLLMTQTLKHIPGDKYLTMKLTYEDNTPSDYQPPGFVDDAVGTEGVRFFKEPQEMQLGSVATPYYSHASPSMTK